MPDKPPALLSDFFETHRGKATDKWASYLRLYDRVLPPYRERPVDLLEIGIQNGGSLELWPLVLPQVGHVVGCDIDPRCGDLVFDDPRVRTIVGDATREGVRDRILAISDGFDIVIDDGSHTSGDIVRAFSVWLPHVRDGGLYIVEDLHCSYWREYEGGLFDPYSSISLFKLIADIVNVEAWGIDRPPVSLLDGFAEHYGCEWAPEDLARVHSVEFVNSMCVIRIESAEQNRLGTRRVSGQVEAVVVGNRELHGSTPERSFPRQQDNPWSNRARPPAEELPTLETTLFSLGEELDRSRTDLDAVRAELAAVTADRDQHVRDFARLAQEKLDLETRAAAREFSSARELEELRRSSDQHGAEVAAMRETLSWRVTAPLRTLRRRFPPPRR